MTTDNNTTNKNNPLSSNLRALMQKSHLTEAELARQTSTNQPVIHRLATGKTGNPKVSTLQPIAKHFGISVSQLIGETPLDLPNFNQQENSNVISQIPFYSMLSLSNAIKKTNSNHAYTDQPISSKGFATRITDTTMQPQFPPNTLLIIEPDRTPKNGDYIIAYNEMDKIATFKQLLIDSKQQFLKPLNADFPINPFYNHIILGVMIQAKINAPTA